MNNFIKRNLLIIMCIIIFLMPIIISNNGILIYYGDSFEEFYQFYLGGWEKIRSLDLSLFDWSIGLGGNTFSYSDMYLFSPYFWITILFPKSWMPYEITVLNAFKLLLCFNFAYLWISKITKNEISRFTAACMYSFSGWVFFYNHYMNFLDAYLMFPLILYFAECYLKNGKFKGIVISMFLLTIQSYYFSYMFVPYACLYGLFRYLMINEKVNLKHIIITAIRYLFLIILGIGMASFVLFPTAYTLFGNPRMSEECGIFEIIGKYDLYKIITSLFTPVFSRLNPDYFISLDKIGDLGWGGGCSLFSFILFPVLFVNIIKLVNRKEYRIILFFYLVLGIFVLFPSTWRILQGTIDTRWFYMIVMTNVMVSALILDEWVKGLVSQKDIICSFSFVIVIMLAMICFSYFKHLNSNELIKQQLHIVFLEIIVLVIYTLAFTKHRLRLLVFGLCCEIVLSGITHIYYNPPREYSLFSSEIESGCIVKELKKLDNSFYRIIYDNENFVTSNEPFSKNYPGISFYYSLYNFEQENFLNRFKTTWSMPMVNGRTISLNQLSAKYYYTKNYTHRIPYGYEYHDDICGYHVYKNKYYFPLAMFMDKYANEEYIMNMDYFTQDIALMNYVVTENSEETPEINHEIDYFGRFATNEEIIIDLRNMNQNITFYFVPLEYNPELVIDFYNEDSLVASNYFYQIGYIDQYIGETKYDKISIKYSFNKNSYFDVYIENHDEKWYEEYYEEKSLDFINDVIVNGTNVDINLCSNKYQTVLTSIPYDRGWKCYIDGNETAYYKANMGFIAFNIEKGEHNIILRYTPPLFKLGCTFSLVSIVIFLLICIYDRNKNVE